MLRALVLVAAAGMLVALAGCAGPAPTGHPPAGSPPTVADAVGSGSTPAPAEASSPAASEASSSKASSSGAPSSAASGSGVPASPPRDATLSIPEIGVRDLRVIAYRGRTDDAPGTRIQNRGHAASPHGPHGGTGPGGIGNYQVTAHRLSSSQAFLDLPDLTRGARVHVRAGDTRWTYEIVRTRQTSFRSAASLAEQRAAVPGRPGAQPRKAFVTLSTCATPEDHAAGNYWSDEFDNPEHRIDKIGVLVRTPRTG